MCRAGNHHGVAREFGGGHYAVLDVADRADVAKDGAPEAYFRRVGGDRDQYATNAVGIWVEGHDWSGEVDVDRRVMGCAREKNASIASGEGDDDARRCAGGEGNVRGDLPVSEKPMTDVSFRPVKGERSVAFFGHAARIRISLGRCWPMTLRILRSYAAIESHPMASAGTGTCTRHVICIGHSPSC